MRPSKLAFVPTVLYPQTSVRESFLATIRCSLGNYGGRDYHSSHVRSQLACAPGQLERGQKPRGFQAYPFVIALRDGLMRPAPYGKPSLPPTRSRHHEILVEPPDVDVFRRPMSGQSHQSFLWSHASHDSKGSTSVFRELYFY